MPLFSSLNNGVITKQEFKIVNSELEQYFKLKEAVRAKLKEKTNPGPDFEKMKKDLRTQIVEKFRKKLDGEEISLLIFILNIPYITLFDNACSILSFEKRGNACP